MSDCLFCKMVKGDVPTDKVAENELLFAFRDINPQAPTHILIIPKEHIKDLTEIGAEHGELLTATAALAQDLAGSEGVADSGYRLVANVGPDAGQTVFHLHFHLIGGRKLGWPPG